MSTGAKVPADLAQLVDGLPQGIAGEVISVEEAATQLGCSVRDLEQLAAVHEIQRAFLSGDEVGR